MRENSKSSCAGPPAVLLGGRAAAVSVARSLGKKGITVYALNDPGEYICYSRYSRFIQLNGPDCGPHAWERFLLSAESNYLQGSVLLSCDDYGVEIVAGNRDRLSSKFILEAGDAKLSLCLLDKLCAYREARAAGIPTPRIWLADSLEQVESAKSEYVYPLVVKPLYSHRFSEAFDRKHFVARDYRELVDDLRRVHEAHQRCILVEFIPGSDEKLCNYYSYIGSDGTALFHYTKGIIRRFPPNMGPTTYHNTEWNAEVKELGARFFSRIGLRGLGNVEFKWDDRDGLYKLIECNPRFTAADPIIKASGFDLGMFVYNQITGRAQEPLRAYDTKLRLWHPVQDYLSFLELKKRGELTFRQWVASLLHPQHLPYFQFGDPLPSMVMEMRRVLRRLRGAKRYKV